MNSVNSRDNGVRRTKVTTSSSNTTVRMKEFVDFKNNVNKRFNGLDCKLDQLIKFITSNKNMMFENSTDTASLSGQSSVSSTRRGPATTINKTLKPYTKQVFQFNPFAQSSEIYQWLQERGDAIQLPMFTSDKELADKLKR